MAEGRGAGVSAPNPAGGAAAGSPGDHGQARRGAPETTPDRGWTRFLALAWITSAATFALLLVGAAVVATGAGESCPGWPLCGGRLVPVLSGVVVVEWSHRMGALVVTGLSVATVAAAWRLRRSGPWRAAGVTVLALLAVQVVLGALVIGDALTPWAVVAHEGLGILLLCIWLAVALRATWEPGVRRGP